ncbi:sulfotransferase 6B1-like isoform X2 [Ascaphus truei]|uniref:sulfotransferase 6B1-like isoform X2 n=1 Tax=Ascaphus truei TaxID=8439 RepID=UPI003F598D14
MTNRVKFLQEVEKVVSAAEAMSPDKLLFTYNGVLFPSTICNAETFEALGSCFESREDDVMLVAYPKCGSNWTLQLLYDMVYSIHDKEPPGIIPMLEFGAPDKFERLKQESSPRVLTTHLFYDNLPKTVFDKKVKMLVVFRNPKDTAVSLFHFYTNNPVLPTYSSWDTFFQDFMSGKVQYTSPSQMAFWLHSSRTCHHIPACITYRAWCHISAPAGELMWKFKSGEKKNIYIFFMFRFQTCLPA